MPQLLPRLSEASHAVKTVFFLSASLLKLKMLQPSPVNLVEHLEVDNKDLRANKSLASHSPFPKPRSPFPKRHCFHPPGISKVSRTAKKFFLAASQLKVEKLNLSHEDGQIS